MARCREAQATEELKQAIRDAHEHLGASVENLSEASGLRIEVVQDLLRSENRAEENLSVLAGLR
jgi:thiamine monophosphate kinase